MNTQQREVSQGTSLFVSEMTFKGGRHNGRE